MKPNNDDKNLILIKEFIERSHGDFEYFLLDKYPFIFKNKDYLQTNTKEKGIALKDYFNERTDEQLYNVVMDRGSYIDYIEEEEYKNPFI